MNPFLPIELIQPGLLIAAGIALFWFPRKYREQAEAKHNSRLAELDAGDPERFFEERRSLQAYRPAKRDMMWRIFGLAMIVLGTGKIATLFFS